jgi:hypothetical protein
MEKLKLKNRTNKQNGWSYIRVKLDTIQVFRVMKAELNLLTYDDLIKHLVYNFKNGK